MDKMLQGRLFSYPDTHRHRLGANYEQIPINCPYKAQVNNGQRDGPMRVNKNGGSGPNYEPNSYGPLNSNTFTFNSEARYSPYRVTGIVGRFKPNHPNCDFFQPGQLFRKVFSEEDRKSTIEVMGGSMKDLVAQKRRDILERAIKNFYKADPELGNGLSKMCGFPAVKSKL